MKNKYSKKYRYLLLLFLLVSFPGLAQQKSFTGTIHDKNGNPIVEALVLIKNQPLVKVFSDNEGKFSIIGQPGQILEVTTKDNRYKSIVLGTEQIALTVDSYDDLIPLGHGLEQPKGEITSAIGFVKADELTRSSVYNPANSLYGRIPGLTVLQNGGTSWNNEPDIFIRGVETFGIGSFVNTKILVLIDGFEGRLSSLLLTEIENVTILKDAAALAIYGLRGANGVLLVSTKKGSGKGLSVNLNYEHGITKAFRIPTFLDSYEYAKTYNQARVNDGLDPYYLPAELERFQSGNSPYLYPNVNWINECLRNYGTTDNVSVSFQEAANTIKYFGVINFYDEEGLLGPVHALEGYSTQINNSRINLRTNVEVNLNRTTKLTSRIAGNIGQNKRPSANEEKIFTVLYSTPSAVFPVKTYDNEWGGTSTFFNNPVAMISETGYTTTGYSELMIDLLLDKKMDNLVKGLSGGLGISYDNTFQYEDLRSKQYRYEELIPIVDISGAVIDTSKNIYGTNTSLLFSTSVPNRSRRFTAVGNLKHNIIWRDNQLNSMLLFQLEQLILKGQNNTYNHLLVAGKINYSKSGKYFADLVWSYNGTNILPKGSRFGFFPALSLAWQMSNEEWLTRSQAIDFLKLRASFGMTGNDQLIQNISKNTIISGPSYLFGANNNSNSGLIEGRLAADPLTYETSYKSNIGIDANLYGMLDMNLDVFYNRRTGILTQGSISGVMGVESPYSSSGIVTNKGMELTLNFFDNSGSLTYHVGGSLSYAKNKIVDMLEEYRPEDYLKRTGRCINQAFGLEAIGFFGETDLAIPPIQTFSIVRPGDIKYKDQNKDNIINELDEVPIGYSTQNPELYFSGSIGAEYKGLGVEVLCQGIANMTVFLNTPSIFWPLRGNNNIATNSENYWTASTAATATYPRITTSENANNFRPNSIWYTDASYFKLRSLELYYKLPIKFISKVKLKEATVYIRGMNLLSFDNIDIVDPEAIGLVYPTLTTYNVGIKIGF